LESRIAPDSNIAIGAPPSLGDRSTIAGMRLLGEIFRNSEWNCSPLPMFTGWIVYGSCASSRNIVIL